MGYLYLAINVLFSAVFTILSKVSSNLSRGKILGALFFALLVAVVEIFVFSALNGFRLQFTWISCAYAAAYGFTGCFGTVIGIKAYSLGSLATYAIISTVGGIVIPFLFGVIALDEAAGICKWVGCALMLVGVVIAQQKKKTDDEQEKKTSFTFILWCLAGALVGGVSQCINKLQSVSAGVIDGNSYVVLVQAWLFVYCIIVAMCVPKKVKELFLEVPELHKPKIFCTAGIYGVVGGLNIVVTLLTNKLLPSVIVFPILSGMSIVMSAVSGRLIFKEKITKINVISAAIIIAAMAILVLPY